MDIPPASNSGDAGAFAAAARAYNAYGAHATAIVARMERSYAALPERHRAVLAAGGPDFGAVRECVAQNQRVLREIAGLVGDASAPERRTQDEADASASDVPAEAPQGATKLERLKAAALAMQRRRQLQQQQQRDPRPSEVDHDRTRSVLRHLVRDWSAEGAAERAACYTPLLDALRAQFPGAARGGVRVLVPGCGLGRLAYDIHAAGFLAQGNEIAPHAILAAQWVLNVCPSAESHAIHPYVHQTANVVARADMVRPVAVPDVWPRAAAAGGGDALEIVAGDFLQVYAAPETRGTWDAVVTSFFLDTGRNVLEYIDTIARCLRPGGVWLNLGPLLYHFSETHAATQASIELTADELIEAVAASGFRIKEHRTHPSTYNANSRSMLTITYTNVFFCAVREQP